MQVAKLRGARIEAQDGAGAWREMKAAEPFVIDSFAIGDVDWLNPAAVDLMLYGRSFEVDGERIAPECVRYDLGAALTLVEGAVDDLHRAGGNLTGRELGGAMHNSPALIGDPFFVDRPPADTFAAGTHYVHAPERENRRDRRRREGLTRKR